MPAQLAEVKALILRLLDEHNVMTVATLRPDGWPQATMVGYVHDDLTLYFAVSLASQKLANITRDQRVSVALGHTSQTRLRGLSMAAHAAALADFSEIEAVNELLRERYAGSAPFAPRKTGSAVVRVTPFLISVIDLGKGPGEPVLVSVVDSGVSREIEATDKATGEARRVTVYTARSYEDGYRPDAPP